MPPSKLPIDDPGRTRPFRSDEQITAISLFRASDALRRWMTGTVEPFGITLQQFNVLRILRGAGGDGLPTLTVAKRMVERAPGVTRLLDRLEADDLVERERDLEDRRRVVARITPHGRSLLDRLDEPFASAEQRAFEDLSDDDTRTLARLLGRVLTHVERIEKASGDIESASSSPAASSSHPADDRDPS